MEGGVLSREESGSEEQCPERTVFLELGQVVWGGLRWTRVGVEGVFLAQ